LSSAAKKTNALRKVNWLRYRVPLQEGYRVHPQNSLPALAPLRAVRKTIWELHLGQDGADAGTGSTA
jgi:hypothetical protein